MSRSSPARSCARIASSVASSWAWASSSGCDAPQLLRPHPRREAAGQLGAVDQPLGLGVAPDQRRRQQWQRRVGHVTSWSGCEDDPAGGLARGLPGPRLRGVVERHLLVGDGEPPGDGLLDDPGQRLAALAQASARCWCSRAPAASGCGASRSRSAPSRPRSCRGSPAVRGGAACAGPRRRARRRAGRAPGRRVRRSRRASAPRARRRCRPAVSSTTASAPSRTARSRAAADRAAATTRPAPAVRASCTPACPTIPPAPSTSTCSPAASSPRQVSAIHAATAERPSAATSTGSASGGSATTSDSGTAAVRAHAAVARLHACRGGEPDERARRDRGGAALHDADALHARHVRGLGAAEVGRAGRAEQVERGDRCRAHARRAARPRPRRAGRARRAAAPAPAPRRLAARIALTADPRTATGRAAPSGCSGRPTGRCRSRPGGAAPRRAGR